MPEMTHCPICGRTLQRDSQRETVWGGEQIVTPGDLYCPDGCHNTVQYTEANAKQHAEP